jgi:hypothetical protein
MGVLRRLLDKVGESDDARLAAEIKTWAESVPGTCRISDCPLRVPVRIAGVVKRITVFPVQGKETLEALVTDGTGEMSIAFMGRRAIPGLGLGTRMIVAGVAGELRGDRRMVNPSFEFTG